MATAAAVAALALGVPVATQRIQPQPLPQPATAGAVLPITVGVPATSCPGPETLLVPAGGTPETLLVPAGGTPEPPTGPVLVSALSTVGGSLAGAGLPAGGSVALGASSRTAAGPVRLDAGRRVAGSASGQAAPVTSAVQVSLSRTGDLRGLAATTCAAASEQAWLVGGGTGEGRRARLLLSNPTGVPAVVDVVPHGPAGALQVTGGQAVVIPAGREVAVFMDAIAPGVEPLAVEVTARAGRFVAVLHDTLTRGTVTGGVDDVTGSAAPATQQVIPGLVLAAPGTVTVRVAVPGPADAVAKVRLLGPDGPVDLPSGVVTVPAGGVRDLPILGVPDGTYTVLVTADLPVVAGALVSRTVPGGEIAGTPQAVGRAVPPSELSWAAAGSALRGAVGIAVPALPAVPGVAAVQASLVLAGPDASRLTLRMVAADGTVGDPRPVGLVAGTTLVVPLDAGTAGVLVTPPGTPGSGGPAYASLLLETSDRLGPMISVVPVHPGLLAPPGSPQVVADPAVGLRP